MPKLWYPEPVHIQIVVNRLAARLFTEYGEPLPVFTLMGTQGQELLESALGLPRQPYYRTTYDKAAVLLRSLIKNHPFVDGNKRAGLATVLLFLLFNRYFLVASQGELIRYALAIAESKPDLDWKHISRWVRQRSVSIDMPVEGAVDLIRTINPDFGLSDLLHIFNVLRTVRRELEQLPHRSGAP